MIDIAYNIAQYLDEADFGTIGTDIFVGQIEPDTNGIWIERSGGQLNNYIPIEETVVDIYIKDIKSEVAVNKLEQIKQYIHRMHDVTVNDSFMFTLLVIGDIEDVQRDAEYEKIYKITLQVVHRNTNLIS